MSVLGIDVGGTKTVCFLADREGRALARAQADGANLQSAGELGLEKIVHGVMDAALRGHAAPEVICLGIAGMDRPDDKAIVERIMRRIGYKARILVVNDALIALEAAVGDEPGIVIVAGTGSIAYGRSGDIAARAGGWGYVLGDEGSGYWIGRAALRAVVRHADGRGPATMLRQRLLEHFGVAAESDLIRVVYREDLNPRAIGALAPTVQAASDAGDAVAADILLKAVEELIEAATAVTARLALTDVPFTFVLSGGVFRHVAAVRDGVTARLPSIAPRARVMPLSVDPAAGAVRLAVAELLGGARIPAYQPLVAHADSHPPDGG